MGVGGRGQGPEQVTSKLRRGEVREDEERRERLRRKRRKRGG